MTGVNPSDCQPANGANGVIATAVGGGDDDSVWNPG
jgi:hypothetical protein